MVIADCAGAYQETGARVPSAVQAIAGLHAPTNHPPAKWFSDLYDARSDFSLELARMRDYFGVASDKDG